MQYIMGNDAREPMSYRRIDSPSDHVTRRSTLPKLDSGSREPYAHPNDSVSGRQSGIDPQADSFFCKHVMWINNFRLLASPRTQPPNPWVFLEIGIIFFI